MGIVPTFVNNNEMFERHQTASRQGISGIRILHDASHLGTVCQVAVFAHRNDDTRRVRANGPRGTPEAKHFDECLTTLWLWH